MKYINTLSLLVLLSGLSTVGLYSIENGADSVKVAAEKLRDDFANLGVAIKTTTEEQATATLNKIKDWVQQQEDVLNNSEAQLQAGIEQIKEDIQAKVNAIATAVETKDEAKANALLKTLEADINANLQKLQDAAKSVQDKIESVQTDIKTKWTQALGDLKTNYQNKLINFKKSLDEAKSYFNGFRDIIRREIAKKLVSGNE